MCLTCIWAIEADTQFEDRWTHVGILLVGWLVCIAFHEYKETLIKRERKRFKTLSEDDAFKETEQEMQQLHSEIVSGAYICGKRVSWTTHYHILRLLKCTQSPNAEISKKSYETLAVLSYLDQMTFKDAFFAFAPSTCMQMFCDGMIGSADEGTRSFAIRTMKTFLQEEMYTAELAVLLSNGIQIAEPCANVIMNSTRLSLKIDAAICLLAMCNIDSNQLIWVVQLLPTLKEWMISGPVLTQHLALELIANMSSRFDLAENVVKADCLPAIFDLFDAIRMHVCVYIIRTGSTQ